VADQLDARIHDMSSALLREIHTRPTRADLDQKASVLDVQAWLAAKSDKTELADSIQSLVRRCTGCTARNPTVF